jgi:hypothetical protein
MNLKQLITHMSSATSHLLREKGYISFVEVLLYMGKLTSEDYEAWRFGKVSCLERVIALNLSQLSFLLRTFRKNSENGGLRPSKTVYVSWGKGPKRSLRFSKFGSPNIEEAYSTHFLKLQERT